MPIDQERLRALTPERIRKAAEDLRPGKIRSWVTPVDGKLCPPRQLIFKAAAELGPGLPPLSTGTTTHETVAVLSHNGFTSSNLEWRDPQLPHTQKCWCGCGADASPGRHFLPGHDRAAESKVIKAEYGGSVEFLVAHRYGPEGKMGG